MQLWNVFLTDSDGNCDRVNTTRPYSIADVEEFMDGLTTPVTAVLLLPVRSLPSVSNPVLGDGIDCLNSPGKQLSDKPL